jgi:hypothetical protein
MSANFDPASLRVHFTQGLRQGDPRWRDDLSLAEMQALWVVKLDDERILALHTLAQNAKNASLGKTPEQIAETLKLQVNLGIGGLLIMIQQLTTAHRAMMLSLGITLSQYEQEMAAALTAPQHQAITARLIYWNWINQVDAEVLACIADPERTPSFPAPPQLS